MNLIIILNLSAATKRQHFKHKFFNLYSIYSFFIISIRVIEIILRSFFLYIYIAETLYTTFDSMTWYIIMKCNIHIEDYTKHSGRKFYFSVKSFIMIQNWRHFKYCNVISYFFKLSICSFILCKYMH